AAGSAQGAEPPATTRSRALTTRERHVLRGIFEGRTNKQIAVDVGASEAAVKSTIQQLFRKTHVRTRAQLVRVVLEETPVACPSGRCGARGRAALPEKRGATATMVRRLVDSPLNNRLLVVALAVLLLAWGAVSFHALPVEAYPDVANNCGNVITQGPGRAAEEIEQQV